MKKNYMFDKGCPLSNKEKMWLALHAEMCSQLVIGSYKINTNKIKTNASNWAERYIFSDCHNCTMNIELGYSGYSGYSGCSMLSGYKGKTPNLFNKFKNLARFMYKMFKG